MQAALCGSKSGITDSHNIDGVVIILDSCYNYIVTRVYTSHGRVVEILAAVDEDSELAFVPSLRASLPSKLYAELLTRKQSRAKVIKLAKPIAHLRESSPVKESTHHILVGVNSLRLSTPEGTEEVPNKGERGEAGQSSGYIFINCGRATG
ncbi:hypothetical protein BDV23DRAFT_181793 [Aspergillus alliaceus]|uniref:Uncharacterized protein n=1 Tax=Petromyces alliaceus TaxID=209559 RepID=A0A5N7CDA2_PETAA|nr:hypothetical protein BDV23DRAFT_181793 [Aspergillus alliaceus]